MVPQRSPGEGLDPAWNYFRTPIGTRVFYRVEGYCLEDVIFGHMDPPIAVRLQAEFNAIEREHGKFAGFHQWLDAPTYDSHYRTLWTNWLGSKRDTLVEAHFLTASRMVRMGLSVANIAYPRIRFGVHAKLEDYLTARRRLMSDCALPTRPS
ncbi:MAG: hypothetical protein R3B13_14360 [Polyangiaceae bacterium]